MVRCGETYVEQTSKCGDSELSALNRNRRFVMS